MPPETESPETVWKKLVDELENFQDLARFLQPAPGSVPDLPGVEIHGVSMPLNGVIGGDHILYIDCTGSGSTSTRGSRGRMPRGAPISSSPSRRTSVTPGSSSPGS